ncbi:hypothetical protein NCS52_01025700 [Fusarium sp. LHS14.1]|nr:hypothetical protein NCS52_01025700 [Fusarium sp. LHS14.1]
MARHQEWECSPLWSKAKNGFHKSARAARANNACQTSAHASPIQTGDAMATPTSPPHILPQKAREFTYRFQWRGRSCTGKALLLFKNHQILSYLPKSQLHHKILGYLESSRFEGFKTDHSEIQQRTMMFKGRDPGCLSVQFRPEYMRLFQDASEEVGWNDDSPDGSATDTTDLRKTPDSNTEPSSESPQTSIPCSLVSSEKVIYRVQPSLPVQPALSSPPRSPQVPTTSTSVLPRKRNGKSCLWSTEEDEWLMKMLMGVEPFCLEKFPGRTPIAIRSRFNAIRKRLIAQGHKPRRWGGSSAEQHRQTFITIANVFQEKDSEDEVVEGVIEAVPDVPERVIRDEYRHLKSESDNDFDGKVKAWLEENRQDRWQDIRDRFPGLDVSRFERIRWRLRANKKTQMLSQLLWE